MKRVFLIVLDSFGIGETPDAALFGDCGSNTLAAVRSSSGFYCPNMTEMGLFNIDGVQGGVAAPLGAYGRCRERSMGKDTTIGHWEIAGIISPRPLPTYPDGFPPEIIERFERLTGRKVLCNKPYSGTEVIKDYGMEHIKTGALIVYTSADSVFQIAAHEQVVPVEELYDYCRTARSILTGDNAVGRVIARPFTGKYPFVRTANRHDFSLPPPAETMPDLIKAAGYTTVSVGKIYDIFAGRGFTESHRTLSNADGVNKILEALDKDFTGLCFANLVDFDAMYGHRNDVDGYAAALSAFDARLSEITARLNDDDIVMITADHGCDPSTPSTDHSREYTPLLLYGKHVKGGVNLGTRPTFADISATVLDYFGVDKRATAGTSFLSEVLK